MKRVWVLAAASCIANAGLADALGIEDVIAAHPPRPDVECSYTTTSTSSDDYPGEVRVERFTPPDSWELLTVNGKAPTAEALEDYAGEAEQRGGQRNAPADNDLSELIKIETAAVLSEDADTVTFSFQTKMRPEKMADKVRGTLTVRKNDLLPLEFGMENTAPVSPAPTVKLQELHLRTTYTQDAATGAVLLGSMDMAMRGKMLVFKKMQSETRIGFSDYDCAVVPVASDAG